MTPTELRERAPRAAPAPRARRARSRCGCPSARRSTSTALFALPGAPAPSPASRRCAATAPTAARCGCRTGRGIVELRAATPTTSAAALRLDDLRDLTAAVQRCRRLLDLDADPVAVDAQLGGRPAARAARGAAPGPARARRTSTGTSSRCAAVLGQQVSRGRGAARSRRGSSTRYGEPLAEPDGAAHALLPDAGGARRGRSRRRWRCRAARGRALLALAAALADGASCSTRAPTATRPPRGCSRCPGIGPWTADVRRDARARRPRRLPGRRPRRAARAAPARAPEDRPRRCRASPSAGGRGAPTPSSTSGRTAPTPTRRQPHDDDHRARRATRRSAARSAPLLLEGDGEALTGLYMTEHRNAPGLRRRRRRATPAAFREVDATSSTSTSPAS